MVNRKKAALAPEERAEMIAALRQLAKYGSPNVAKCARALLTTLDEREEQREQLRSRMGLPGTQRAAVRRERNTLVMSAAGTVARKGR